MLGSSLNKKNSTGIKSMSIKKSGGTVVGEIACNDGYQEALALSKRINIAEKFPIHSNQGHICRKAQRYLRSSVTKKRFIANHGSYMTIEVNNS